MRNLHRTRLVRGLPLAALAVALAAAPGRARAQQEPKDPQDQPGAAPDAPRPEPAGRRIASPEELLALALDGPRADMARLRTRAARAQAAEARAARYPKLSLTSFVAPSPEITCDNPECTRTTPEDFALQFEGVYGSAKLSAVQPVYTFGKLDAITRAARLAARATERLEGVVAGELAVEAARAYYGLKLARELEWMLEDGLVEVENALARIEERLEEGTGEATIQDKLRVQTLLAEVRARLSEARRAEATALAGVRALAGAPEVDVDEQPLAPVDLDLAAVDAYLAKALVQRPEIEAARMGAEAAEAKRAFESAQYWPDVVVVGEVSIARAQGVDDPPSVFADDPFNTTTGAVALALRWQLDPMTQRARVAQARAQAARARARVELAKKGTRFDVRTAYAQARAAKDKLEAARQGVTSARGWVASVLQAEAIGAAETQDLADALIAYFTLRTRYATSVYEWNLATKRLARAVGELAPARDE